MKNNEAPRHASATTLAEGPQERLVVREEENLHVLARFMRALILNLLKEPGKVKALEKMNLVVAIEPTAHEENAFTITFSGGRAILECGVVPKPNIILKCEPAVLMKLARVPAGPEAIQFFRTPEGRDLVAKMLSGELKMKGVVRHPLGMMKFADFLALSNG